MKPSKKTSKKPQTKVTAVLHYTESTSPWCKNDVSLHLFSTTEKANAYIKSQLLSCLSNSVRTYWAQNGIKQLLRKNKISKALEVFNRYKHCEIEEDFEVIKALPIS